MLGARRRCADRARLTLTPTPPLTPPLTPTLALALTPTLTLSRCADRACGHRLHPGPGAAAHNLHRAAAGDARARPDTLPAGHARRARATRRARGHGRRDGAAPHARRAAAAELRLSAQHGGRVAVRRQDPTLRRRQLVAATLLAATKQGQYYVRIRATSSSPRAAAIAAGGRRPRPPSPGLPEEGPIRSVAASLGRRDARAVLQRAESAVLVVPALAAPAAWDARLWDWAALALPEKRLGRSDTSGSMQRYRPPVPRSPTSLLPTPRPGST